MCSIVIIVKRVNSPYTDDLFILDRTSSIKKTLYTRIRVYTFCN